jgi:6-phosphogluconolactonase
MNSVHHSQTPVRRTGPFVEVRPSTAVASAAAQWLARRIRDIAAHQNFVTVAVSGGRTPETMLQALVWENVPWKQVLLMQVDERVVGPEDPRRNSHQLASVQAAMATAGVAQQLMLLVPGDQISTASPEAVALAAEELLLRQVKDLGVRGIDIVHLGLGDDGHTASLIPGDPVNGITDRLVAATGEYQGTRRVTLTAPLLARSGQIMWLATGAAKAQRLAQVLDGDRSIPAGQFGHQPGVVFCDEAAAPWAVLGAGS